MDIQSLVTQRHLLRVTRCPDGNQLGLGMKLLIEAICQCTINFFFCDMLEVWLLVTVFIAYIDNFSVCR